MSTRHISWGGKGSWCIRLTTLPPPCADYVEIASLNRLEPVRAYTGIALPVLPVFEIMNLEKILVLYVSKCNIYVIHLLVSFEK
jgi:hypothetical protein